MPISPGNIERQMKQKGQPDKMGEEGALFLIDKNEFPVEPGKYAKKWKMAPDKNPLISDPRWRLDPDYKLEIANPESRSIMSPFWARSKFYEYKVMNSLFPDNTVKFIGAYDNRITKNDDGEYEFDITSGNPVSVSEEVIATGDKAVKRDEIIEAAYEKMFKFHNDTNSGLFADEEERQQFKAVVAQVDKDAAELLGQGLRTDETQGMDFDEAIEYYRSKNPNSAAVNFLEHGISPVHPAFNFIPRERDSSMPADAPAGIYIELKIIRPELLMEKVESRQDLDEKQKEKLMEYFRKFVINANLDAIFDAIMLSGDFGDIKVNKRVQSALFNLLEVSRQKLTKSDVPAEHLSDLLDQVVGAIGNAYDSYDEDPHKLQSELNYITNVLRNSPLS